MRNIQTNRRLKKTIQGIFESELKPIVEKELLKRRLKGMVNEADSYNFPGYTVTNKALKDSGKQNSEAMKLVSDKLKKYLDFKNNSNPQFPHQNNSKTDYNSPMYRNSTEQEEYIEDWRGMGLEDAQYSTKPNKQFEDQVKDYMQGSTRTGNNTGKDTTGQQVGNVVPSELGKNKLKKVARKYDKLKSDEWAKAIPNKYGDRKRNADYMVSESTDKIVRRIAKQKYKTEAQKLILQEAVRKEIRRRKRLNK